MLSEAERPQAVHRRILAIAWAGWLFDFYDLMLYSFLLVPIAAELHFNDRQSSLVLGASLAATALGGIVFGRLADRYGRRRVLIWTIFTYSAGTLLCSLSRGVADLLLARAVTGMGVGGEWAAGQAWVGETVPPAHRGRYAAFMQTGAPAGIGLAAVVGGFVAPAIGWRWAFALSALPALLVSIARRAAPESDLWEKQGAPARAPMARLLGPGLRSLFLRGLVLALFDMCAYWFTYSWLPAYLHRERGLTLARSGLWLLVTQAGGVTGYVTFGWAADRWGRRLAYSLYGVLWATGLSMVTLGWGLAAGRPSVLLFFMFWAGVGTGNFSGYGPLFAEIFPTDLRTTAMGTAFNLARGVQFLTPLAITWVAARSGLAGGISLAALFALLTGAWVWTLPETRGRRLEGVVA